MPDWGPVIRERLASVSLAPDREAEIVEELSLHLDDRVREMIAGGTDAETAETIALAELRASDLLPRYLATLGRARWIDPTPPAAARPFSWTGFAADVRHSLRRLAKSPSYAVLAILTLSLGIGANAATFTMANWLIFRPIPGVRDESTLVTIRISTADNGGRSPMYAVDIDKLTASVPALTGLAGYADIGNFLSVTAGLRNEMPARVEADLVTASYFPVLGVPLALGRSFTDEEGRSAGAAPAAIVSDMFFRTALHGDAQHIGRPFLVNGRPVTLIGVATKGFRGTRRASSIDLWLPAPQRALATPSRAATFFALAGRRRTDAPLSVVQDQLRAAEAAVAPPGDQRFTSRHFVVTRGLEPVDFEARALRGTFALLMAFSGLLFLLACANVSNANLARAAARRGEIATRLALGGSRLAIARMLFVDSLVPAILAGVAALLVARLAAMTLDGTALLIDAAPLQHVELDWRVLSVGVALAMLAAVATGMWPMLAGARTGVASVMRDAGGAQTSGRQRLARVLMAAQITLSFVLVAGAMLLGRSMYARLSVNPGFDDTRVLTFSVDPLALTGRDTAPIYRSLVERLRDVPGAWAATRAFLPPFYSGVESRLYIRTAADARNLVVGLNYVEPGFFDAIGLPIVAGRDFTSAERNGTGPAKATPLVIGEWLARRLFGDRPAVGEFVTQSDGTKRLIVGVVRDARHRRLLDDNSAEMAFQPFQDNMTTPLVTFVVGFSQPADTMWPNVRHAIARVDPALPIFNAKTAREGIRAEFAEDFLVLRLTLVFGGLALLVAASGLYSVLARRVGERQRELGIRAARRRSAQAVVARDRGDDRDSRGWPRRRRGRVHLADALHPEPALRRLTFRRHDVRARGRRRHRDDSARGPAGQPPCSANESRAGAQELERS